MAWILLTVLFVLGLVAITCDGLARQKMLLDENAGPVAFNPGHVLASCVLEEAHIWYWDENGRRRLSRMTIHAICGPTADAPRYVRGFCHYARKSITLRVDRIIALTDLDTGETFADPAFALRGLVWRNARRGHRTYAIDGESRTAS